MPSRLGNKKLRQIVKKIMGLISKHKIVSILLAIAVLGLAGFWLLWSLGAINVKADDSKLKNFTENEYGFSMSYPANWSLDVGYDRYAKGLMNANIANKKCGFGLAQCDSDCVDARILIGKKPASGQTSGLLTQLYEDFMMARDFSNASPLVKTLDIGSRKVYKVDDNALTLALNGSCSGPLYIFETNSGYFVYVFAGYGANAASGNSQTIEKIISSINIK
jgi:hypothetical protein